MSDLTSQEQVNVRTALRFLRARRGGWVPVAKVLRLDAGRTRQSFTNGLRRFI